MRKNKKTRIIGTNVMLVPYMEKHVSRYHEWMKSEELQHFTASEALSLEEEYRMQQEWLLDEKKCTFIVLDKDTFDSTKNELAAMIGDTNLFFNDPDCPYTAEAEIMIAETESRGKRRGWEAMILMLRYGIEELKVKRYRVKITIDNEKSISMFRKLDFHEMSRNNVFQEITFERNVDEEWKTRLYSETSTSTRDQLYATER